MAFNHGGNCRCSRSPGTSLSGSFTASTRLFVTVEEPVRPAAPRGCTELIQNDGSPAAVDAPRRSSAGEHGGGGTGTEPNRTDWRNETSRHSNAPVTSSCTREPSGRHAGQPARPPPPAFLLLLNLPPSSRASVSSGSGSRAGLSGDPSWKGASHVTLPRIGVFDHRYRSNGTINTSSWRIDGRDGFWVRFTESGDQLRYRASESLQTALFPWSPLMSRAEPSRAEWVHSG